MNTMRVIRISSVKLSFASERSSGLIFEQHNEGVGILRRMSGAGKKLEIRLKKYNKAQLCWAVVYCGA